MPPRSFPKYVLLLGVALTASSTAFAQVISQGPGSPMCQRLEGQLASINSGAGSGGDPARADQIRRYQDAATKQQAELERVQGQARRQGCESSGFFSMFTGQSAQCAPINNQIQQMRANLDQITTSLQQLRNGASTVDDNQRRSVMLALAQNNCGQQYVNAVRSTGGFLDTLFGGGGNNPGMSDPNAPNAGTYRTVCARSCDGAYFPISFATVPSRFQDDERTCKALCPNSEATLFTYRNPGEDIGQAVSLNGQPYSQSPNAFRFRTQFDKTCSCRAPGQSWADALKNVDDSSAAAQGDIIVTPENAKKLSQPVATPASRRQPATASPAPAAPETADTATSTGDKPIRSVGPTFVPNQPSPSRPN
ncbi:MAG: DUF2865 domain-containing protein [Bradyrhizobiaceae bacterium]|nr:MAG: DUF2865 domain-containing protein [Bradyrhizobiaceae bacterium]